MPGRRRNAGEDLCQQVIHLDGRKAVGATHEHESVTSDGWEDVGCRHRHREKRHLSQGNHELRGPLAGMTTVACGELARAEGSDERSTRQP